MALSHVNINDPVLASLMNNLIDTVNGVNGRAVYTANGNWTVPAGVQKFRVTICGGGGKGGASYLGGYEGMETLPGSRGGDGPLVSKIFSGQAVGTVIPITIGAGGTTGNGGQSTFGALLQSGGGAAGGASGVDGADGTHNGELRHNGDLFLISRGIYYGMGGVDSGVGRQGICVIEW